MSGRIKGHGYIGHRRRPQGWLPEVHRAGCICGWSADRERPNRDMAAEDFENHKAEVRRVAQWKPW